MEGKTDSGSNIVFGWKETPFWLGYYSALIALTRLVLRCSAGGPANIWSEQTFVLGDTAVRGRVYSLLFSQFYIGACVWSLRLIVIITLKPDFNGEGGGVLGKNDELHEKYGMVSRWRNWKNPNFIKLFFPCVFFFFFFFSLIVFIYIYLIIHCTLREIQDA